MPIVENDTEDEIEYRVNDDGTIFGSVTTITGGSTGTIVHGKPMYHQIEWLNEDPPIAQWVPSHEKAKKIHPGKKITINSRNEILIKDRNSPTQETFIQNKTPHTVIYRAMANKHVKVAKKNRREFEYDGTKYHQVRWPEDEDFKTIPGGPYPSDVEVTIKGRDNIKIKFPLRATTESTETAQTFS